MRITIDRPAFIAAQVPFESRDSVGVFTIPDPNDPAATQEVNVAIVGGELHLFPERSSAHRRVIAALGLNT